MERMTLLFSLLVVGCSVTRVVAPIDSVRVEIRESLIVDTVIIEIPREVERVVTFDTVSFLENSYAKSMAEVSGRTLRHSLETKPQKKYVPVVVTVTDTLIVEKESQVVEVERQLTWWENFCIHFAKVCMGVLAGLILFIVIKMIVKF